MTDNELAAEDLAERTFRQAFAAYENPSFDDIDRTLIAELRRTMSFGSLSLHCEECTKVAKVRENTLRVDLERAVMQLPLTERLIFLLHDVESYDHYRITRYLGLSHTESQLALHQARLRIRELLAAK
jgi:DNA-directed RNA polymerase specialized sigma24 family protein